MSTNVPRNLIIKDFHRDVWCLFGLPVDNLTMESAKRLIREKVKNQGNYVLSTINVNGVVQSIKDPLFRKAIINSDIVTIDGRPLLWLAKLLGYPMKEVVAGSSLIEELLNEKCTAEPPLTLYLFGGDDGVAKQAMELVNQSNGGLKVVGAISPGFGSVEELSRQGIIAVINEQHPDILLVALGAKKGVQWIEHNKGMLNAKIVSYLGATINFLAGSVRRAPKIFQRLGIEWLWRIYQEPLLLKRYVVDGWFFGVMLAKQFVLYLRSIFAKSRLSSMACDAIERIVQDNQRVEIKVGKVVTQENLSDLRKVIEVYIGEKDIALDLTSTIAVNKSFISQIIIFHRIQRENGRRLLVIQSDYSLNNMFCQVGVRESLKAMELMAS